MKDSRINPEIMQRLEEKLKKEMSKQAIRSKLSRIKSKHHVKLNIAAEILAQEEGFSITKYLNEQELSLLGNKEIQKIPIKVRSSNIKQGHKKIIEFAKYPSSDVFLNKHLVEINKAYTASCYTATFILCRKVIENLIKEMIKRKFPNNNSKDKAIYLDLARGRIQDLSILIKNLLRESEHFDPEEKKLVQRILQRADEFKDDANDKTHSLYHISNKKELDEKDPQMTLDLIKEFFSKF